MTSISNELDFTNNIRRDISINEPEYGKEWPIVYLIYNENEVYIGETVDASIRLEQHYENPVRRSLDKVRIISDKRFNKSVILDLESYLISHMSADTRFKKLQNGNAGHQRHNYYERDSYVTKFPGIWSSLRRIGLAEKAIRTIENDNLFKFSPYKSLTDDQYIVASHIIRDLVHDVKSKKERTFIVNGGPGTGKTVLAIYLMKLLSTDVEEDLGTDDEELIENIQKLRHLLPKMKIGIVVSMSNLRATLIDVFNSTYGLDKRMVFNPSNIANSSEKFDLLIVDESHRLKAPRNMMGTEMRNIRDNNMKLGLDENDGTQLDWIIKKSKYQIFFYDKFQSIKRTDIDSSCFEKLEKNGARSMNLDTQVRCGKGGQEYVNYVRSIFSDEPPECFIDFKDKKKKLDYDFRIFDNVREMTDLIKKLNRKDGVGLCRNIAGYGWPWKTKNKIHPRNERETEECIRMGKYDIDIKGNKYIWNSKIYGWVGTENSENEVGCIHTIQGYDLNYAGIIIGNELKYDKGSGRIIIDRSKYYDKNGKNKTSDEDLRNYILNIYSVLCTRGISGTFVYACDDGLRDYLKQFIKSFH